MIYLAYQAQADLMASIRALATVGKPIGPALNGPALNCRTSPRGLVSGGSLSHALLQRWNAACEMLRLARLTHGRPSFGLDRVTVAGEEVRVTERAALTTPFGTLLHFRKEKPLAQPPCWWSRR